MFLENDEEDTSVTQKSWRNISTPPLFLKDIKWRIWEMKKGPSEGDDLWHIVCRIQVIVDYGKKPQPWRTILQAYNLSVDMNLNLYHLQWMNIVQTNLGRSWHTIRMLEHLWNGIGNRKAKNDHIIIFSFSIKAEAPSIAQGNQGHLIHLIDLHWPLYDRATIQGRRVVCFLDAQPHFIDSP